MNFMEGIWSLHSQLLRVQFLCAVRAGVLQVSGESGFDSSAAAEESCCHLVLGSATQWPSQDLMKESAPYGMYLEDVIMPWLS